LRVRIATRGSRLARWQAEEVARMVTVDHDDVDVSLVVVETSGDRRTDVPIWEIGGQGVFVKEVQAALLDGRADIAVHSAKDLPSSSAPGLVIAAVPERGDPRDAMVGSTLSELCAGATVATGSVRRRAQLAWIRPDLTFAGLRGNIDTRLANVPQGGAVVVAAAAVARLGLSERAAEVLDTAVMLPQVGQGSLAAECREGDEEMLTVLRSIEHAPSRVALECERGFLARLGGGCDLPVGAYARCDGDEVVVEGMLASPDGRVMLRSIRRGDASSTPGDTRAAALGASLAEYLLSSGGADLLAG
jgi:hydroxymethylbilane synthase